MKLLKGLPINPEALKKIPVVLRQPQWVAAIVSVGFHGALFAAGPSFSTLQGMASESAGFGEGVERRVPMVELTPEEQARLPDFDSPAYSLLPEDFLSGNSDRLATLLPPSGNRLGSSSLPLPGGLSSSPRLPTSQPPFGFSTASPFSLARRRSPSFSVPLPSSGQQGRPASDRSEGASTNPEGNAAASTPTTNRPTPSEEPSAEDLRPRENDVARGDSSVPLDNSRDASEEVPPEVARSQDLIARVEYNSDLTTTAEAESALTAWTSAVTEQLGEAPALAEDTFSVEVPYDLRICLTPEPADGLLGFVLLPGEEEGTVDISTTVLKSTGYPFLNQSAAQGLKTLAANSETPLEMGTLYRAVVKVLYSDDDCVTTDAILKRAEDEATPSTPNGAAPESEENSGAE